MTILHLEIIAKAAGLLKSFANLRRFGMTKQLLLLSYKTNVMPIVMYGCPVWHPSFTEKHRSHLETIQTRACKIILVSKYKNYKESLSELRLPTLDEVHNAPRYPASVYFSDPCTQDKAGNF